MEAVKEMLERKYVVGLLGLIVGILIGLGYAWGINPVEWVDATPAQLREDLRDDYMRMIIESYAANRNVDLALDRYGELGDQANVALGAVAAEPEDLEITTIQNFHAVVEVFEGETMEGVEPGASSPVGTLRVMLIVFGIIIGGGLIAGAVLYIRSRLDEDSQDFNMRPTEYEGYGQEDAYSLEERLPSAEPLATFRTTFTLGDDMYDDSFSIESASGDFLGECGVGIAEVIGAGEPKKVAACEVWLFDKNDIQTVTKVLVSEYALKDTETLNRLAAKGDPVMAESGATLTLETASLEIEARVVDIVYGQAPLPENSYFERLTVELRAISR